MQCATGCCCKPALHFEEPWETSCNVAYDIGIAMSRCSSAEIESLPINGTHKLLLKTDFGQQALDAQRDYSRRLSHLRAHWQLQTLLHRAQHLGNWPMQLCLNLIVSAAHTGQRSSTMLIWPTPHNTFSTTVRFTHKWCQSGWPAASHEGS